MAVVYELVSADSHIIEPPHLWRKWLPAKFHDRAPKMVKDEDGGDAWLYAQSSGPEPIGLVASAGKSYEQMKWTGFTYHDINQGCFEPKARVQEMLMDGVDAEVIYPPQRMAWHYMGQRDPEFQLAGIQAYNNWLGQEFCATALGRLVGIAQMPNLGVEPMVAELERTRKIGLRGAVIATWPSGKARPTTEDDPFWAAAQEMGAPVSIHVRIVETGAGAKSEAPKDNIRSAVGLVTGDMLSMPNLIVEMIFSGMFDRFPDLKLVAVETGAGWLPFLLEKMDDTFWCVRHWADLRLKLVPSDYFRRNWHITFIKDAYGVANRHRIGIENMMWSTDYPHHKNDWPYSRRIVEEMFLGVDPGEKHQIVAGNAARLYQLS